MQTKGTNTAALIQHNSVHSDCDSSLGTILHQTSLCCSDHCHLMGADPDELTSLLFNALWHYTLGHTLLAWNQLCRKKFQVSTNTKAHSPQYAAEMRLGSSRHQTGCSHASNKHRGAM